MAHKPATRTPPPARSVSWSPVFLSLSVHDASPPILPRKDAAPCPADIFATAAALAAREFQTLEISPNRYADRAARFDLSEGLVERLQAAGILCDEDATGACFNLCSWPTRNGRFVGIVERRDGHGAPGVQRNLRLSRVRSATDLAPISRMSRWISACIWPSARSTPACPAAASAYR